MIFIFFPFLTLSWDSCTPFLGPGKGSKNSWHVKKWTTFCGLLVIDWDIFVFRGLVGFMYT